MRVTRIQRTIVKGESTGTLTNGRSMRQFARDFCAKEIQFEFAIEALAFGALFAISAWPLAAAVGAINALL
ncbi:MAG TPA: hypothetical protein VM717_08290 [Chthoniobacterales bacterium]|nr:hypothetical protein [Chthoniobacterales bacterium]